jgi:parallel beta-helix repeat protein
LLLFCLTALSRPASALTSIPTDTVWHGQILLKEDLRVEPEATLHILPGTVVRFAEDRQRGAEGKILVTVQGTLVAEGRADAPILFTSAAGTPAVSDWAGIAFDRARNPGSRLRYCEMEYAEGAIRGGSSKLTLEHVALRRNRIGFAGFDGFEAVLIGCEVSHNVVGIEFSGVSAARVENCKIIRNSKTGIICRSNSSPIIAGNTISDNTENGIACTQGSSPEIKNNVIRKNSRGVFAQYMANPNIWRNHFTLNDIGIRLERLAAPHVQSNIISRNRIGIYCNFGGRPRIQANNILENEESAVVMGDQQSLRAEEAMRRRHQDPGHREQLGARKGLLRALDSAQRTRETGSGVVDARENWWGKEATREIRTVGEHGNVSFIRDYRDEPEVEFVGPDGKTTGERYPRDVVDFSHWADTPAIGVGPHAEGGSGPLGPASTRPSPND